VKVQMGLGVPTPAPVEHGTTRLLQVTSFTPGGFAGAAHRCPNYG